MSEFYSVVAVLGVLPRLGCSSHKKILFMALLLTALLYYNLGREVAVPTSGQRTAETKFRKKTNQQHHSKAPRAELEQDETVLQPLTAHIQLGTAVTPLLLPCAERHVFLNICRSGFSSWANARLFAHALLRLNSY